MNQHDYFSMDAMGRSMYDAQQAAIDRAHESLREILFGRVEPSWTWEEIATATRKNRRDYAVYRIKAQPFFMSNAELRGRPLADGPA